MKLLKTITKYFFEIDLKLLIVNRFQVKQKTIKSISLKMGNRPKKNYPDCKSTVTVFEIWSKTTLLEL